MRILTIGMGGAGCRIADSLLSHDRTASAQCIGAVAIDCDAEDLAALLDIESSNRLFFLPLDPTQPDDLLAHVPKDEMLSRLQAMDDGDIDAVFVCAGLGGTLASAIPDVANHIKGAMVEPVFGLCTLPLQSEDPMRLARAADQLDSLLPVLDGVILFDNEAWKGKVPAAPPAGRGKGPLGGVMVGKIRAGTVEEELKNHFSALNSLIGRRVLLLLRAGEHSYRDPGEMPEMVLDAGEVLNTIEGTGLVTLGYAREEVAPARPFRHLLGVAPRDLPVQECHVKASRVVDLARKAVFEEISTPTALEKVKKALVLVAGPSHEMSMKGFMAVRKWLDRSIGGLELRAGDYPVRETRYLGILVVLAGMDTLPRVEELREIRARIKKEGGLTPDPGESGRTE
ncbi:MAG: tubulin/FtsZ family protein [Methanolinea sp.]|nr:tubulin/FtsZ family protein [Methanolinea sp.]